MQPPKVKNGYFVAAHGSLAFAAPVQLGPEGQLPDWMQVLPAGTIDGSIGGTDDGSVNASKDWRGPYYNDDPHALVKVLNSRAQRGTMMQVDPHHQSERAEEMPGVIVPSLAWGDRFEVRNGGEVWMHMESYTPKGAAAFAAKELRYISPVILFDKEGHIRDINSIGATNNPNFYMKKESEGVTYHSADPATLETAQNGGAGSGQFASPSAETDSQGAETAGADAAKAADQAEASGSRRDHVVAARLHEIAAAKHGVAASTQRLRDRRDSHLASQADHTEAALRHRKKATGGANTAEPRLRAAAQDAADKKAGPASVAKNGAEKGQGYNSPDRQNAAPAAGAQAMDWNEAGPQIAQALGLNADATPDDVLAALGFQAAKPVTTEADPAEPDTDDTAANGKNRQASTVPNPNEDPKLSQTLGQCAAEVKGLLKAPQTSSIRELLRLAADRVKADATATAAHAAVVTERDALKRAVEERRDNERKALASATFAKFTKKIPAAMHDAFKAECAADPAAFEKKWSQMPDIFPGGDDSARGRAPAPELAGNDVQAMQKNAMAARLYQQEMATKGVSIPIYKALQHVKSAAAK
jgi:phage I-like protein